MNFNNEQQQFELLDILTVISFGLQLMNQKNLFTIADVHKDNERVVNQITAHLAEQDAKIDKILERLGNAE